ncbi:hypothetical protein QT611_12370 [Pseudomonas aeruginosa]|nr:hypothetical protein [Pseudomonas aeruginosa]
MKAKARAARSRLLDSEATRGQRVWTGCWRLFAPIREKRDKVEPGWIAASAAIQATNPNDEAPAAGRNIAAARKAMIKYLRPEDSKGPSLHSDQSTVTEAKNQLDRLQADYRNAEQKLRRRSSAGLLSYADYVAQRGELISRTDGHHPAYEEIDAGSAGSKVPRRPARKPGRDRRGREQHGSRRKK